jgi:hypothetical protein
MRNFSKTLSMLLAVMLISTLMFGQSSSEKEAIKMRIIQEQYQDIVPGIKPVIAPLNTNFNFTKVVTSDDTKGILYDNGSFITQTGVGSNSSDYSDVQMLTIGMGTMGYPVHTSLGYSIADDFEVSETWDLTSITFYAYQPDASGSTTSPINDVRYQIYDGDPSAGGIVIYGDLSTNQLVSTEWTNVWRILDETPAENRPIMAIVANAVGCNLTPGTYWIEWQAGGTQSSGPWAPPITIVGEATTGDALQNDGNNWIPLMDAYTSTFQGIPFVIEGSIANPLQNDMAVIGIIEPEEITENGMKDLTIKLKNYGETSQSNFVVSYSINGGTPVTETVSATVAYLESYAYTFTTKADLSTVGSYELEACVALDGDESPDNNCAVKTVDANIWYPTALEFDGTDQYVQTTYIGVFETNPRTIKAWIYLDAAPGANLCICDYGEDFPGERNTFMVNGSGYLAYISGGTNGGISASVAVPIGEWVHVAFVYNGKSGFLYQNEEQVGTGPLTGVNTPRDGANFMIGQRVSGGSIPFMGKIDEVSFWNRALSQQEVIDYACVGDHTQYENLTAYYNFGDGSGTTLTDLAQGNDGTLINMEEEDWVASDVCTYGHGVTFVITGGTIQIGDAVVDLDGDIGYSDPTGEVTFYHYAPGIYNYTISKSGYAEQSGSVEVIDQNVTVEVDLGFTSIIQHELFDVDIYPNPTDGVVNLRFSEECSGSLTITDVSGRIIHSFIISKDNEQIDLSGVGKGMYFIKIQKSNEVVTLPLIVK